MLIVLKKLPIATFVPATSGAGDDEDANGNRSPSSLSDDRCEESVSSSESWSVFESSPSEPALELEIDSESDLETLAESDDLGGASKDPSFDDDSESE